MTDAAAAEAVPEMSPRLLPAEGLPVGEPIDCGSHQVTEAEIVEFASEWDPQYFHVDRDAAAHSEFGGLIASGLHTTAIFQRLAATALYTRYDVIAGRVIRECRFLRPVWPGDVLSATAVVTSVELAGRGRAEVVIDGTLRNQAGAPVLEIEVHTLFRSRAT